MITIFQVAAWLDQFGFDSYLLGLTYVPTNSYSMCMRICTDAQMHARTHARMHACTHANILCTLHFGMAALQAGSADQWELLGRCVPSYGAILASTSMLCYK